MKARYTRASPSPRYRRLLEQYRLLHENGEQHLGIPPELTFAGQSLPPQAAHIKRLIRSTGSRSLLDYGSGKGTRTTCAAWSTPRKASTIRTSGPIGAWTRSVATTPVRAVRPTAGRHFRRVICTDVLEHIAEEDIAWILDELFAFARKFLFANVACFPARKRLPSGANAHCTIKPLRWWEEQIARAARSRPGLVYEFRLAQRKQAELKETVIAA